MLERTLAPVERILARYGVLLDPLADDERSYFEGVVGVLVREVWIDTPADTAGLWPGDFVVGVNDQPVATIDDLQPLIAPTERPLELRVRRGARTAAFTLGATAPPAASRIPAASVGLILDSPSQPYRIDSVVSGSRAARAGIRPGDRLVRINRVEPRNRAQVDRALAVSPQAPMLLEIERDARRIAIVVP
jgi:serine protease DegQ